MIYAYTGVGIFSNACTRCFYPIVWTQKQCFICNKKFLPKLCLIHFNESKKDQFICSKKCLEIYNFVPQKKKNSIMEIVW